MRTILVGAICVAAFTACSPAPTPAPKSSTSTLPVTSLQPSTTPPLTVAKVKQPWQAGQFQYGVQLYWHTAGSNAELQTAANRTLNYIVGLGANSVGITYPIYTDGAYPTRVYSDKETPSLASLAIVITAAKLRGLRVTLRPIIDEANILTTNLAWRGSIQPANQPNWFNSYDALLVGYARLAQRYGVQELVAGTELNSLQTRTTEWQALSLQIDQTGYTGLISYSYNWNDWSAVPFTTLGVDAYPKIDLGDNATVAQLASALSGWLDQYPLSVRLRLAIQEAGIPAESGMYQHPYLWGLGGGVRNLVVQANWFAAICLAAKASKTQGVYYWMLDSNIDPSHFDAATQPSADFIGRPAEQEIRRCFAA